MPEQVQPSFRADGFNCPRCGIYAHQRWNPLTYQAAFGGQAQDQEVVASTCARCLDRAIWFKEQLVYPLHRLGPEPQEDMPSAVRELYDEARAVSAVSRKSAAGLLRLA